MMVLLPIVVASFFARTQSDVEVKQSDMAKKDVLKELEAKHGDLEALIVPIVNRAGQKAAADRLNISQATISTFLKSKGYVPETKYVKKGEKS